MDEKYSHEELEQMSASELEQLVQAQSIESTGEGSSLSTEQMALLNTLMYCDKLEFKEKETLGQVLSEIKDDEKAWENLLECNPGHLDKETTEKVIEAIMNDEELCSLRVAKSTEFEEGSGNPVSVCFVNECAKEAIVAYCGTRGREWLDNGEAFMGEDSKLQREAAEFLQKSIKECGLEEYDITVTGHSKGGNKAQYVAVMCPEVDNCYSFDGQGFSREFIIEHFEEVIQNKDKINSYVADADYVSPLGIEVAQNLEIFETNGNSDGFDPYAHTPDAYYNFDKNGNIVMNDVLSNRTVFAEAVHDVSLEIMDYPKAEREECFMGTMGVLQNIFCKNPISESELPSWGESLNGAGITIYQLIDYMNDGALDKFRDNPFKSIADLVHNSWEKCTDKVSDFSDGVKDTASDAVNAFGNFASDVTNTFGDFIDGIEDSVNDFSDDVKDTVGKFVDNINDNVGEFTDEMGTVFES